MHTMRLELEEAKSKEAQLMADLATAGELTQEISRLVKISIYTREFKILSGLWLFLDMMMSGKESRSQKDLTDGCGLYRRRSWRRNERGRSGLWTS